MNLKLNIVCDVDLCVVRTDHAWNDYLAEHSMTPKLNLEDESCRHYDLSKHYPSAKKSYDFWNQEDLYSNLKPIEGSVEGLQAFSERGYNILFASYCKKGHFGSKYDWLKEHFPFMNGFYATKEKHHIKANVFIDDRNEMLNRRYEEDPLCILIKMKTNYTQNEELTAKGVTVADRWGVF